MRLTALISVRNLILNPQNLGLTRNPLSKKLLKKIIVKTLVVWVFLKR